MSKVVLSFSNNEDLVLDGEGIYLYQLIEKVSSCKLNNQDLNLLLNDEPTVINTKTLESFKVEF